MSIILPLTGFDTIWGYIGNSVANKNFILVILQRSIRSIIIIIITILVKINEFLFIYMSVFFTVFEFDTKLSLGNFISI